MVGKAVRIAIDSDRGLEDLELTAYRELSDVIEQDVYNVLTVEGSVAARDHIGGTAPAQVRKAVASARAELNANHTV